VAGSTGTDFDPSAWAEALADWLVEQVRAERALAVALYRLRSNCWPRRALEVHRQWGASCSNAPRR
jgi:hypothetical protein